jgi:hypothetical protein
MNKNIYDVIDSPLAYLGMIAIALGIIILAVVLVIIEVR